VHVETYTGDAAVEHFADASRQQERPLSDWEPTAPLPEPEVTTPLTPDAVPSAAPTPAAKPQKKAPKKAAPKAVDPVDGQCPDSHPVKGKLASGLCHVPGGLAYNRTKPDRCYVDAAAAEAEGLTQSKR